MNLILVIGDTVMMSHRMAAGVDRLAWKALLAALAVFLAVVPGAFAAPPPGPLTPATLGRAYALPRTAAGPQTVAIVVAYRDPTLARDLSTFSRQFSLPACTSANRCLREVNQRGESAPLAATDPTGGKWITETALGVETIHGICQNCRLLVVEADAEDEADLAAAVDTAVRLGAREISTSFGFVEGSLDGRYATHYDHPGIVITAASGDTGFSFGTNVPAAYPGVVAVGGTNLRLGRAGRWAGETVWKNSDGTTASGCSLFTPAPPWQAADAAHVGCAAKRAVADVAAAAAPGAPLYSSTPLTPTGERGWVVAGGTSLASPIVAGVFALAGGIAPGQSAGETLYAHLHSTPRAFHDIVNGSNGSCSGELICQAGRGYDGPSGVGTPDGLAGFGASEPAPATALGHSAFIFSSSVSEIFLGCPGRTVCRGRLTLAHGNTLLAGGARFSVAAGVGALVRTKLDRAGARLLTHAAGNRLRVTLKVLVDSGAPTSTSLTLVELPRARSGLVALGNTGFVSRVITAGIPLGCPGSRACKGSLVLTSGRTTVSARQKVAIAANHGGVAYLHLTRAGHKLLARRPTASIQLVLQRVNGPRSITSLNLASLK